VQPHVTPLPPLGTLFPRLVYPHSLSAGPKHALPPLTRAYHPPSTPTSPDMMRALNPFTATPRPTWTSFRTHGKLTRSERGSTPTPPPSWQGTSPLSAPNLSNRTPRSPLLALPKARTIRAPLRPPNSRQPATVRLVSSRQTRSPLPKEGCTLPVPLPLSTNRRL